MLQETKVLPHVIPPLAHVFIWVTEVHIWPDNKAAGSASGWMLLSRNSLKSPFKILWVHAREKENFQPVHCETVRLWRTNKTLEVNLMEWDSTTLQKGVLWWQNGGWRNLPLAEQTRSRICTDWGSKSHTHKLTWEIFFCISQNTAGEQDTF